MPARRSRLPPPKAAGGCDVALTVARGCHAAQRRNLQGTVKRIRHLPREIAAPEILCVKISDNAWRLERRRQNMDSPFFKTFYVNSVASLSP
ncbi:hypothetical protein PVAP13_2KG173274 [Panicum virgatum]|uniref:Uncharacterized protein n=1 Tax=Panicum virgatum TaxID=38727 RepID=A0A8T0W1M6_PANVG|nr:hypothetical protein PVAP13_2KG173274 [Panicum virgatum]